MSTYTLDDLLCKWSQGSLSAEQAIGHILQHLKLLRDQQASLERRITPPPGTLPSQPPPRPKR